MREIIRRGSSTKTERIFSEILKRNHIPFKYKKKMNGMEIDFIIGNYAIELDGHLQKGERNRKMFMMGYTPVHYQNSAIRNNLSEVERDIKEKYELYNSKTQQWSSGRKSI